jgi:hypothetical protein
MAERAKGIFVYFEVIFQNVPAMNEESHDIVRLEGGTCTAKVFS